MRIDHNYTNIFLISYYFSDVLFDVIDKINKFTKSPYRIIVGDNISINSNVIRKKLREYLNSNKIHAAYLYDDNTKTNIWDHMFEREPMGKYTVLSDGDSLISVDPKECWLTEFINVLENDKSIGIVGYSSKNNSLFRSKDGNASYDTTNKQFHISKPEDVMKDVPFQAHFMTLSSSLLKEYFNEKTLVITDGNLQRYVAKRGYNSARYDKSSVYNASTLKCGYTVDDTKLEVDSLYKKDRLNCKFELMKPGSYVKITN